MKEKLEMKLYVYMYEDGDYLILNTEAENEKEVFGCTDKISEATLLTKKLLKEVGDLIEEYAGWLYVEKEKQFKKILGVESFGLYKIKESKK